MPWFFRATHGNRYLIGYSPGSMSGTSYPAVTRTPDQYMRSSLAIQNIEFALLDHQDIPGQRGHATCTKPSKKFPDERSNDVILQNRKG